MPTYDYRCPQGHDFERFFRKISDAAAELPCPECGAMASRRLSGGAGLLFKGSGFYLTDYGRDAHRKPAPAAGGDTGGKGEKADKGDGAGPDATPAAKPDEKAGAKPAAQPAEAKTSPAKMSPAKPGPGDKAPKAKGGE